MSDVNSKVGLITFSDQAKIAIPFNAGESWDVMISKTSEEGGSGRRVDVALQLAKDELFSKDLGSREGARKVSFNFSLVTAFKAML